MAELAAQFLDAQSNIEPSDDDMDNAPAAHQEISDLLGDDDKLKKWGINPYLIGSYGRRVSIRRVYDVDMFCRLEKYPAGLAASSVLDRVETVLTDKYGDDAVTREDKSITVLVPDADGLYVDVVPAREADDVWEIPTDDEGWQRTNPIRLGELKEEKNDDFDEMYVPCVKLLRQARRNLLGKTKPGGFSIEMAVFTAAEEGALAQTTSMMEFFTSAIEGVADILRRIADEDFELPDPSMEGEVMQFDADADWDNAATKFETAAADARAAYGMAEDKAGKAALLMQGIFGGNEDHQNVFPMPPNYDENGNARAKVNERNTGSRAVTAGSLRFG